MNKEGTNALIVRATFPNDGRLLKRFIIGLLKSKSALEIYRMNYVKHYYIDDSSSIVGKEKKLLEIVYLDSQKDKLVSYFKKQHPQGVDALSF